MLKYILTSIEDMLRREGGQTVRGAITCQEAQAASLEVQVGHFVYRVTLERLRDAEPPLPVRLTLPERWQKFVAPTRKVRDPYEC